MTSLPFEFGEGTTTAFVGVAKNSGKTTALTRFVEAASVRDSEVGLLSIGIDGETRDAVLGVEKPSIPIVEGTWVVAGADVLARSSARFEYVEGLGASTPLGRAYLARSVDAGEVVLGGLRHRQDLLAARDAIREAAGCGGSTRVLVDGAYGRRLAADGRVAETAVLSTGAVVGETPTRIVEATECLVDCLRLSEPVGRAAAAGRRAAHEQRALFATPDEVRRMSEASALRGLPASRDAWPEQTCAVAVPGAVTDGVLEELMRVDGTGRTLVAMAPASIRASSETWRAFRECDWDVSVRYPVELSAIAANPVDPAGGRVSRKALVEALSDRWPTISVFDARRPKRRPRSA